MSARIGFVPLLLLLPLLSPAQEPKLPVLFLRYDGGVGIEEIEPEEIEEEQVETSSQRHRVSLRIKEQWSDDFTTNLYATVSRKEYFLQSGSYSYFYLAPEFAWDVTDRIQWSTGLRSKWTWYDQKPEDLTSLLAKTELAISVLDGLKLTPFVQGIFDLYQDRTRAQQTYIAGLGLESRLSAGWKLNGRYRGIARTALGTGSAVLGQYNHEFGVNFSWDPNK
jgi:hypothetical protein